MELRILRKGGPCQMTWHLKALHGSILYMSTTELNIILDVSVCWLGCKKQPYQPMKKLGKISLATDEV